MDGENNGKPYEQMDDLGVYTIIFGSTPFWSQIQLEFAYQNSNEAAVRSMHRFFFGEHIGT